MDEQTRSNPTRGDQNEAYGQFNDRETQRETQQGFERDKEDVVPESAANADELYSGEQSGEIVDPELLRDRQRGAASTQTTEDDR
jgi:hypothetical protein